MKTEVKVAIGFGVLALGYYLYTRNEKSTTSGSEKKSNASGRTFCTCKNGARCSDEAGVDQCTCCGSTGSITSFNTVTPTRSVSRR